VLSDEEKRAFYDKYGPEEEVRERMHQQQQQQRQYYNFENEMSPEDLFRMFFGGDVNIRRAHRDQHRREPPNKFSVLVSQLLPFLLMFLIYVVPYLLQSVSQMLFYSIYLLK
jgi:DnaJ-class molecular chaperone